MSRITDWAKLPVTLTELCLATTLRCGQSFRWKQCDDQSWTCVLRGRILQLDQDESHLKYRSIWPITDSVPPTPPASIAPEDLDDSKELLRHYLNLTPNLEDLYRQWSESDRNFQKKAPRFTGVRILRQDAWEALVGFICSSNNNIIRISQMVDKLCMHYGRYIATFEGRRYHDFPPPNALTGDTVESHLRELGFGYRAKYIAQTARMIANDKGHAWLDSLRNPESPTYGQAPRAAGEMKPEGRDGYREAHEKLLELQGVGPKVADCVCLMGLGWGEAVPIDTHVWQIAQRDYKFGKGKHSSLTKTTYDAVANHFRKLWGKEAGWAHSVLFTADLKVFAERLEAKIVVKKEKEGADQDAATIVSQAVVSKVFVKEEPEHKDAKRVVELDETMISSSERVKRRRRR
ncbi:8-oxoguanine glycosylase ogg1 [Neophaeococcomyces mojaviensis]|uniref:8-oxoguanine glycosylase ogg1 n=1 Tax=Neophaeococcomyces mojaviensis TaxID=3383035 RepID=A0ACC3A883_9EURO|nr:8-oxoguanine glycosylase ogg1 [Knufia sp. JES_112]